MKIIKSKKGLTLIEVILAVAIFAMIALPLLSIFVQSMRVDVKAGDVLNANYISQDYLEKLDTQTYSAALASQPSDAPVEGYSFTAKIQPYGSLTSLFSDRCSYLHIILFENGSALCVMPDGQWHVYTSIPSSFMLVVSSGTYTFTGGYTSLTGPSGYNYCAVIVNAMKKPDATAFNVNLAANCQGVLYCKKVDSGEITFTGGISSVYEDLITADTSLIYITTELYDPAKNSIATSDSYTYIRNW